MILAINVNAALDKVLFIDRFLPNTHMRVSKADFYIGGKGLDTALVLQSIGAPTLAISFIAGKNGKTLADLLDQNSIAHDLIWLPGETREANIIVETSLNRHTHLTTFGYEVTREDCDLFLKRIFEAADNAQWGVMAGSLPKGAPTGFYAEIVGILQQRNVKTLIDNSGLPLLETLKTMPDIVKMNQSEFEETFKVLIKDEDQLILECKQQMDINHMKSLVITCGKDGILAFTPEGIFQAGVSQKIKEVNAAGAGDAVSAAIVYHLSLGESWSQSLSWAAATGAAVAITEGTAECHMSDVRSLHSNTWVKRIE